MVRTMISNWHPNFPVVRLLGAFVAGALPLVPATGQVPVIPRAEPVVESAAIANTKPVEPKEAAPPTPDEAAPAVPDPPSDAPETSESEADRAAALAALVHEEIPFALVLEPANNGSDVFVPISQAKESGLTAARWQNGVMRPYGREEFRALDMKWKEYRAKGLEVAEQHLALIDPVIDRDVRGTVELVRFISESPLTATGLFTGAFREKLENILGLPFYAVAPSRSVVMAFAKTDGGPSAIGALATGLFNDSIYPASQEIFEVGKDGVKVVGTFKED
jgi:hypothetical protein